MADIDKAGCLIFWGYNPSISRLTHATATVEALKRGMKLIVIDPRNAGLANKADVWLRVRPGTDGALALGLANVMIERGWFDAAFIRAMDQRPLLVRADTGRLLSESELGRGRVSDVALSPGMPRPSRLSPMIRPPAATRATSRARAARERSSRDIARRCRLPAGVRPLRSAVPSLYARRGRGTCWIARAQLEETARLIWQHRPVAYYAWSGHEQHANTTETARAMALLYALTGSFDAPGGNVLLPAVPPGAITGEELPAAKTPGAAWASPSARSGQRAAATSRRRISIVPSSRGSLIRCAA